MASKIEIISNSMILIGANPISSLSEGTEGVVGNALYEEIYENLLSIHPWRFATKKQQLSRLTDTPLNNFSYKFQLPSDLITVLNVYNNHDYEIYKDTLFADYEEVSIDYRFRVDETLLPSYFVKTLQYYLASEFAITITDNSQRAALYNEKYEMQLKRAKYVDSSSRPSDSIQDYPLIGITQ